PIRLLALSAPNAGPPAEQEFDLEAVVRDLQ
ncbi:MAG: hypothetical protein ACI841_001675, partial [Planctomycetota bacterium]